MQNALQYFSRGNTLKFQAVPILRGKEIIREKRRGKGRGKGRNGAGGTPSKAIFENVVAPMTERHIHCHILQPLHVKHQ